MALSGILLVDKPAGWTSHDVVAKLRGLFHERRIGHSGTLDPMATGLLVVFVGRATRAVEYAEAQEKEYIADLRLGLVTDTQDTTGNVLKEFEVSVTEAKLEAALSKFRGRISQIPPMYSAIKVNGKKLYEIARRGGEVERKPREVEISRLEILDGSDRDWQLSVRCSKGTYIRTLCNDLGEALGCGGVMSGLRRTCAGDFSVENAYTLETLMQEGFEGKLLPVDSLFSDSPALTLGAKKERLVRNGVKVSIPDTPDGTYRVYGENGTFLMMGRTESGVLKNIKNFFDAST